MAFSKKHLYSLDDQHLSDFCKAIAYPGRIDILRTLHQRGKLTVQELHQHHPITEETFSDHLLVLRKANLIVAEERYPYTLYTISESTLEQAFSLIRLYMSVFK